MFDGFPEVTFRFLRGVAANNDKAWLEAHRSDYEAGYGPPAIAFVEAIAPLLRKVSKTVTCEAKVNGSLFRIHRDVRFSKDKAPYKDHIDAWFWEGERRGWDSSGFFFRMKANHLALGAGMHHFEREALERYRAAVVDPRKGRALVKALDEVKAAGPYQVGTVGRKTVPRGFDAEHERAPLLLHDGLVAVWEGPVPAEARTGEFPAWCAKRFADCAPVSRWLMSVLRA